MTDQTLERYEVAVRDTEGAADRARLLTEGVFEVIEFLNRSGAGAAEAVVVHLIDESGPASAPSTEAFIEAVRGLVQSATLERESSTPATNIVVTRRDQEEERTQTDAYLAGPDGRFSRGTTYDLRETAA
jgi:hypothetical protein